MLADQINFSYVDSASGKRRPAHFKEFVDRKHDLVAVDRRKTKILRALAAGERSWQRAVSEHDAEAAEEGAISLRTELIAEESLQKSLLSACPIYTRRVPRSPSRR